MKKDLLAITLLLFISSIAFAQNTLSGISGSITSSKGQPLPAITVTIGNSSSKTDDDGVFLIRNIKPGTYVLAARGVGFTASRQNILIENGQIKTVNLQLNEAQTALTEVVIRSSNNIGYARLNAETGTRTNTPLKDIPQAIQVISKTVMNEQQVYRLNDVFKDVAGITEQGDYNYVNIRGFLTTGNNFMINGQRNGYYGLDESPQMPYVDHVEVLKGASSILYGNGAIGGTINIVTKKPKKEFNADANLTVGSFGLTRFQTNITGPLNQSKSLTGLISAGLENGGYYYKDFKNRNAVVTPVITWDIDNKTQLTSTTILRLGTETSFSTGLPVINGQLFAVPYQFKYSSDDGKYNSKSIQEQLNIKHDFSENLSGNLWLSAARRSTDASVYEAGDLSVSPTAVSRYLQLYNGRLKGYAINAYLNYKVNTGKVGHSLVIGFDYNNSTENYPTGFTYYKDIFNSTNSSYPPALHTAANVYYQSDAENYGPTRSTAAYLQDQLTFSNKLKGLLALRYDKYQSTYYGVFGGTASPDSSNAHAVTPKIGLVYQPGSTLSFYGSYSQAFQPQSSNSRAAGGPFPPLTAKQYEFGVKGEFLNKRLLPTITYYHIHEVNALRPDPADPAGIKQITVGSVTSKGLEVTLTGVLTTNWNILANYAKNNIADETGGGFGDTPRDAFSLWTTYRIGQPTNAVKLGFGYRTQSQRTAYTLTLPGYNVFDALVSYQYKKFGLAVNGFNLTGKRYALGTFSPSYYFEGTPRSVQFSLNYNW
ncbi:TonB-dependent siderophore receptor [Mucilaginibacter sp. UYCu711]|uniref:TonB-dependent siderophore receptor n=1 Tax=Mucilaginibacter sp. UYCu711 TaxID=3156339 RepID=UPI003D198F79